MRVRVVPYGASNSAKLLAEGLGGKRVKLSGSRYVPRTSDVVINWGHSTAGWPSTIPVQSVLNNPYAVNKAANKLDAFNCLRRADINIPLYTTSKQAAEEWLQQGKRVFARTLLRAHSGRGIVDVGPEDILPDAPLYVLYVKKVHEYRVHVYKDTVIDIQRKMRNTSIPDDAINWRIRNHSNGFVFGREDVFLDERTKEEAVKSVQALGLDFGAVDMIYNEHGETFYVLEVNTAPGLTGTTLTNYLTAFGG